MDSNLVTHHHWHTRVREDGDKGQSENDQWPLALAYTGEARVEITNIPHSPPIGAYITLTHTQQARNSLSVYLDLCSFTLSAFCM